MERIQQIEELIHKIETVADPNVVGSVRELVQALMDFHGAGIERMMEIVSQTGEPGSALIQSLARDDLTRSLLLLYGLHPDDLETRVRSAVHKLRGVELVAIRDGVVRLRSRAPRSAVEEVIYEVAPDVAAIEIEGGQEQSNGFVPLESLFTT